MLELRQHDPRIQELHVDLRRPFDPEEDRVALEQAEVSLASGTHLVVALSLPEDVEPLAIPAELFSLVAMRFAFSSGLPAPAPRHRLAALPLVNDVEQGDDAPRLVSLDPEPAAFFISREAWSSSGAALVAPRTRRGLCFVATSRPDSLVHTLVQRLQDRDHRDGWMDRHASALRARFHQDIHRESDPWNALFHPSLADRTALHIGDMADEAALEYRIDHGGELLCTRCACHAGPSRTELGRSVRGEESFTLPLSRAGPPRGQLVLVRRTRPVDSGNVVRVFLDEEDLGPWHLGNRGAAQHWQTDLFRVAPELLEGRDRATFRFRNEPGAEVHSFRYRFLVEEDPAGLWLTELDPESTSVGSFSLDQSAGGGELRSGGLWFLRGIGARGAIQIEYSIPAAYHWFEAQVGIDDTAAGQAQAQFRILVNGEQKFHSEAMSRGDAPKAARTRLHGPCRLTLQTRPLDPRNPPPVHFGNPVLLRAQP